MARDTRSSARAVDYVSVEVPVPDCTAVLCFYLLLLHFPDVLLPLQVSGHWLLRILFCGLVRLGVLSKFSENAALYFYWVWTAGTPAFPVSKSVVTRF